MQAVVPSDAPAVVNDGTNQQLAKVWQEVEKSLRELAEVHGQRYDPDVKDTNVRANLDRVQNSGKPNSKMSKAKEVFSGTLEIIKVVGGMVADAAGQVFAPAGQCYNALNFVISAYQNYQDAFASLSATFEKCNEFLNRLKRYEQCMTAEMNEICCNTLRHFVLVCQKALRLRTSVLFKVKTFASIAFLSKNEFSDLLATMKSLAFTEIMQSAADTYKNVNETKDLSKGTFAFIQSHQNEKAEERKTNKERSILIDALALEGGKDKWNSTMKAPVASWTATYQNIQQNTVSGTGGWLLKEKAFKAWVKQKSDTPILAVVGEEATGKSYLAANTIFNLQKHGSGEETGSRHHVGYFFVGEKKDNAGIDALGKSIIWQFAVSDLSYMQSIANICDKGGPIGPKEFLTKLLLDNHKEMQKIDATFYIVVNKLADEKDNIHDGVVDFLRSAKHSSNKSVRIIFTTTQGAVDKLKNQGLEFPVIPMSRNTGDIQKYIDWRMDSIGVLSNLKNEQIKKLRDEIKSKLPGQTHRSYYMIDNFLERISTMDLDKDIREALGNAGGDLARRIDADIKRLNEARTSEELEDINTMIIWIMFAKERMTVEKMNAVLEFRNGAVSLTSLEDRLRKKFLLFEVDNSGCVDFRSEQILAGIHERATVAKEQAMSSDTVNEGEVKILTHFLGTVCPPGLVDKLELREHFHSKLKPAAERVYKEDKNTAHFHLARTCLGVLVDKESPTLKVLRGYAARQLVAHMSKVTLGLIGSHLKKDIGSNLVQLFRSGHAIDNQFWANEAEPGFPKWLGHDGEPEASIICDWLRANPPSLEKDPKARAWVEQLLDEQAPLKTLLKPSILRMAHYAFQDYQSDSITDRAYRLVLSFTSQYDLLPPSTTGEEDPELRLLLQVEEWAQVELEAEKSAKWHFQVAVILYQLDKISPARDRCREARKIDKKNWRASLLLVKLAESSDKPKGILKDLIERFEDDAEWKKEHQDPFAEMLFSLGDIYWTRDKRDQADQWFNKCLLSPDSRYKFPFQILSKYHEAGRFKNVFESLKSIFKGGYLIPMMLSLEYLTCDKKNMHAFFQNAMQDKDALETIDSVYMKAIGSAVEAKDRLISFNLRHFYAGLLSTIPSPPKERILGLLENAARDVPYTGMDPADTFFLLGSRIGSIYLANAKRANDEEEAGRWLSKLSDIVPEQVSEDQMRLPLRLFAARYNKLYGNIDAARKNVHSTLKMAIELLSDGDDSNDLFAYMKIFFAALAFGDADNATTALAVMDIEAPDDDDDAIECSCQCGYKWKDATDMYWCMDCMTVVLTKDCTKRVQDPNTCTSVCDQGHGYLCISGWVCKAAKKFSKCQVPYKGDIITLKKWKSYLTHEYKLKNNHCAWPWRWQS